LKAFNYAKAADPDALLFINDYNLESSPAKLDSLIAYVNELKGKGAKVDGIGTQMHMSINTRYTDIDNMFRKLAATGLKVRISELDIRVNPNDKVGYELIPTTASYQADMYYYVIRSYINNVPAAQRHGVTIWGVDDRTSWIRTSQNKMDFPLLFDEALRKKPAYSGVLKALRG
jgi:endo-1,4-beta-xylanase